MQRFRSFYKDYGPGIAVAATGVGAGDLVAASVAGAMYGTSILWAAVVGAVIKYALNEGIARWQLATGTTILEGWQSRLHKIVSWYFIVYLFLWSFIVAAALISACGLAAHAIIPSLSVTTWGIGHSILGAILVLVGRYLWFERLMKLFTGLMFVTVLASAILINPNWGSLAVSVVNPSLPEGSAKFLLGVMGGVGGSVTLLSYGYWIRERGWYGQKHHRHTQKDLGVAYGLTGLFGLALIIIAAEVSPNVVTGDTMALEVARRIEAVSGATGKWIFLFGFWGAVFTSLFGVWQSVPYYFADFVLASRPQPSTIPLFHNTDLSSSWLYRGYLLYLAFPPMLLLLFGRPVWIVVIYSIAGAFFMPFLALTLLWMNSKKDWAGALKSGWVTNVLLLCSLLLFGYLCVVELSDAL
jgi:Mn2+/Fe2+ NRAMP family transporter